jgi:hypothetical protein
MIEATLAAAKKVIHGIQSSGVLKAALLLPAAAPAPAGPSSSPKRPRGTIQFPSPPLPDRSPSSQMFLDTNIDNEENNLNLRTRDGPLYSAFLLLTKN